MSFSIKIIATTVPAIAIATGAILVMAGNEEIGVLTIVGGIAMQFAWLVLAFGGKGRR